MTKQRLRKSLRALLNKKENYQELIPANLGVYIKGKKKVKVPNRHGYCYVRLRSNSSEVLQVFNDKTAYIYDLPVVIARDKFTVNKYVVVSRDLGKYDEWGGGVNPGQLAPHGQQHSFGYSDPVWVYKKQFMPLLLAPIGGTTVAVYSDFYMWEGAYKSFPDTTIDLSPAIPAIVDYSTFITMYVDGATNTLVGATGTAFLNNTYSGNPLDYASSVASTVGIPLGLVLLSFGDTEIVFSNIYDIRPLWTGKLSTDSPSNGAVSGGSGEGLRRDTTNDPLTGPLDINVVNANALRVQPATYTLGAEKSTGSIPVTSDAGALITGTIINQWYAVEAFGGPWSPWGTDATKKFYIYNASNDGGTTWTGRMGYIDVIPTDPLGRYSAPEWCTDYPNWGSFGEIVGTYYFRFYFKATTNSIKVRVADSSFANNSGTLSWKLYDVTADFGTGPALNVDTINGTTSLKKLAFVSPSILTLASDAVTVINSYHLIAAQTGTADDLVTISSGTAYQMLTIQADTGDTITVKHGTGNIFLNSASDFSLAGDKTLALFHDGTNWSDVGVNGVHIIQDEGINLAQRTKINFVGAGVTATDNVSGTVVTILGMTGTYGHEIQDDGVAQTQRNGLNFVGGGFAVYDSAGATIVSGTASSSGGGHEIQDDGVAQTTRAALNFVGTNFVLYDSPTATIVSGTVTPTSVPAWTENIDGSLATGTDVAAYVAPGVGTIVAVYIRCKNKGSAGSTIVDVHKNGTTIFTTQASRPTLLFNDADGVAKSGTPDVTTVAENDVFTFDIDGVATGAEDLSIGLAVNWISGGQDLSITAGPTFDHLHLTNSLVAGTSITATLGNVIATHGDVVIGTSGHGIDFSAETGDAAGMTSELLDDYEEGTWTPGFAFGGGTTSLTYAVRGGVYTKIGNLVTVSCICMIAVKGSSTGNTTLTGLPFTINSTDDATGGGAFYANAITYSGMIIILTLKNTTTVSIRQITELGGDASLTHANFANGSDIRITISYRI